MAWRGGGSGGGSSSGAGALGYAGRVEVREGVVAADAASDSLIGGLRWRNLSFHEESSRHLVFQDEDDDGRGDCFYVHVICAGPISEIRKAHQSWMAEAHIVLRTRENQDAAIKIREHSFLFDPSHMDFKLNASPGWLLDLSIRVERTTGVSPFYRFSFDAEAPQRDAVLVVAGRRLHVNRAFLSLQSGFFCALFTDREPFVESRLAEIPIGDVEYDDFLRLLELVHPGTKYIDAIHLDTLLTLADRFDLPAARHECERFMCLSASSSDVMLDVIVRHKLIDVLRHVLYEMTPPLTGEQLRQLAEEHWQDMGIEQSRIIKEKLADLAEKEKREEQAKEEVASSSSFGRRHGGMPYGRQRARSRHGGYY